MKPSNYQKSFGDPDSPPLVAGSVFGIRTYSLEKSSFNLKPSRSWILRGSMMLWKSSTMEASCKPWLLPLPLFSIFSLGNGSTPGDGSTPVNVWKPCSGKVPNENCTCGIYGYWKVPDPDPDIISMTAFSVVEASGKVILGTKGFRAQKVRMRALYVDREVNESLYESLYESISRRSIEYKLRRRYEVPLYDTVDKMLYDFPLTQDYLYG